MYQDKFSFSFILNTTARLKTIFSPSEPIERAISSPIVRLESFAKPTLYKSSFLSRVFGSDCTEFFSTDFAK